MLSDLSHPFSGRSGVTLRRVLPVLTQKGGLSAPQDPLFLNYSQIRAQGLLSGPLTCRRVVGVHQSMYSRCVVYPGVYRSVYTRVVGWWHIGWYTRVYREVGRHTGLYTTLCTPLCTTLGMHHPMYTLLCITLGMHHLRYTLSIPRLGENGAHRALLLVEIRRE